MGIFDVFKKKAELSIVLEKNTFSYSEIVKGKVIITPLEDFTSNQLNIGVKYESYLDINGLGINDNISRLKFSSQNFVKGEIFEKNFEFNFIKPEEIKDIILNQFNSEEEYNEIENELGLDDEKFYIYADFDIPGFDVHEEIEVNLIKN